MPRIFHPIASCFACVGQVVGQMKKRRQFPFASALTFSPFAPYFLTTLRSIRNQKFEHLTQKTAENGGFPKKIGPSDRIRTCGILLPNLSGILFPLVYSGFRHFLICFTYSLTLLSPLFPGVPAPYVVIYVVKNASRPVFGEDSPVPDGKRFSLLLAAL